MTYCVAIKIHAGLVFLSDSRTNAGLDNISSFRKMVIYENTGERFMTLLSAGNLSITQTIRELLQTQQIEDSNTGKPITIWTAPSMFEAARILGAAVRHLHEREGNELRQAGIDFNVSFLFGGQIKGEAPRLFQVYAAGNFIEATTETPFFQIGEFKYGKPVLDRVLEENLPLGEAAKCALVSMDSTLKSNLSVGMPLDLVVYTRDSLTAGRVVCIDEDNTYFRRLRKSWGEKLRQIFDEIEDPDWSDTAPTTEKIGAWDQAPNVQPLRKIGTPQEKLV
ncbi:peptidase [Corticibacter populi]|uniref:Peptidase n=1 Tax=Corticibacter populi TaxID=1550736 RepID=A0A3M6QZP1_9BURK|nr:proteasome-type protease [Corticibacter populi]RMX08480.1 peptidase [Corticibacter populi]RZS35793.1 putative proteasome-type protease [Corticibacter populi]